MSCDWCARDVVNVPNRMLSLKRRWIERLKGMLMTLRRKDMKRRSQIALNVIATLSLLARDVAPTAVLTSKAINAGFAETP
jgi:uncharacterized membrane protein